MAKREFNGMATRIEWKSSLTTFSQFFQTPGNVSRQAFIQRWWFKDYESNTVRSETSTRTENSEGR
jgi:hypothetical protein